MMTKTILIIIAAVLGGIALFALLYNVAYYLYVWFKSRETNRFLKAVYSNSNVYTYGYQGTGKDLLQQHAINLLKMPYYSNIFYGEGHKYLSLKDLHINYNTYDNLINDEVQMGKQNFEEGCPFFISDLGIYFPSQYHRELDKIYSGTPLFIALVRQCYGTHFHGNCQDFERVWDKLREQFSAFIWCRRTIRISRKYLLIKAVYYDTYNSAKNRKLPNVFQSIFQSEQFESRYGVIRKLNILVPVKKIQYNTRYFKSKFFFVPEVLSAATASSGAEPCSPRPPSDNP